MARSPAWITAVTLAVAASCIRTTPFQSDPSVTGVTQENLERLAAHNPGTLPFKFVAFGDTHSKYDATERTVRAINARDDVSFVVIAGDLTNYGLLEEYEWMYEVLSELDVPWFTAIGNHDALSRGKRIYSQMYGPYDYSFTYASTKLVIFNSNTLEFDGAAPDRDWLVDQISDRGDARGVMLVTHHDVTNPDDYADGNTDEFYAQVAELDGVQAIVHGHIAGFELTLWHGTVVVQCGNFTDDQRHTLVTVAEDGVSFELCDVNRCDPAVPVAEESMP